MKKTANKKPAGKRMTVDELAGIVKNSFASLEESLETKLETKLEAKIGGFRAEVNGRFADINSKFFETKDQLNLLQNKMERVEKLFDTNDAEHKVFRTKIGHLEKAK